MAFGRAPNQRFARAHSLVETTAGDLPAATDADRISMVDMTLAVTEVDDEFLQAGDLWVTDTDTHSAEFNGTINVPFNYPGTTDSLTRLLKAAFRDTAGLPAEVELTGLTVDFVDSLVDVDGVSKPALRILGSTTAFDGLLASSSLDDLGGTWLNIVGNTTTPNNNSSVRGPVLVTTGNPRPVSADSVLSLDKRAFNNPVAAAYFGTAGAWTAEDTGETGISLDAGSGLFPQQSPASGEGTFSVIISFTDVSTSLFFTLSGLIFSMPTLAWSDRGMLTWQFPYVAKSLTAISDTDPISGQSFVDGNLYTRIPRGGSGVTRFVIATDTTVVLLAGDSIISPTTAMTGEATLIQQTIGSTEAACYTLGPMTGAIGFSYLHKGIPASVAEQLELMSAAATRERATLFIEWTDPDGNVMWMTFHELALKTAFTAAIGGASGFASGAFAGMVNHRPANGAPQWPGMGFQTIAV